LYSRFEVRAALFVPGGQPACRPWTVRVESAGSVFFVFVTYLACLSFDLFSQPSSVAGSLADGPPGVCGQSARRVLVADGPRCSTRGLRIFFGQSAGTPRTVRRGLADSPPGARGQSTWYCAGLQSPLLLHLCFRFGIVWSLFLGLVGPL
jgi:hypothetical protein